MKILQYIALILILWGMPSFTLVAFGETVGSNVSYFTYFLLIGYYFFSKKRRLLIPFLILGFAYFLISGLIYVEDNEFFIKEFIKYGIIIICGAELARNTTRAELCFFLFLGSISILVHSLFFVDGYGRYSGFYLNPNGAAIVSLIGYCLTFNIENKKIKYLFIFLFTFTGILTFSRFFFLMWLFISIISVFGDRKNAQSLLVGFIAIVLLFSVAAILQVNTERFSILEGLISGDSQASSGLSEDSRIDQWAVYLDKIYTSPIVGNGYKSFSGVGDFQGVHNSYLMAVGEAGIIPMLILIYIYVLMLIRSLKFFKNHIHRPLIAITLAAFLMVMHNYFNNELILFISIWLFVNVSDGQTDDELEIETPPNQI